MPCSGPRDLPARSSASRASASASAASSTSVMTQRSVGSAFFSRASDRSTSRREVTAPDSIQRESDSMVAKSMSESSRGDAGPLPKRRRDGNALPSPRGDSPGRSTRKTCAGGSWLSSAPKARRAFIVPTWSPTVRTICSRSACVNDTPASFSASAIVPLVMASDGAGGAAPAACSCAPATPSRASAAEATVAPKAAVEARISRREERPCGSCVFMANDRVTGRFGRAIRLEGAARYNPRLDGA